MIDNHFRRILPPYVDFVLELLARLKVTANQITWAGFAIAILAAYFVYQGDLILAAWVWWISRLFDACDGIYARKYNQSSDFGAFLDIQLDMAAYSLMILAFYLRFPEFALQWFLILFCYVLCISGALGLGAFKKSESHQRRLHLAAGLAEGGETGIAYTVFLLLPQFLGVTSWIWFGILCITILARLCLAKSELT